MLEKLKNDVLTANLDLVKHRLVIFTWGNASAIDRKSGLVVIKPSGVKYEKMTASDMVVVDLEGNVIEGNLKPSSDTPTHLQLYKAFESIGGIVHTHSTYATAWAQSGRDIAIFGTTHADYFFGDIPCTRGLTKEEAETDYEKNTAKTIVERLTNIDPLTLPAVLAKNHGVFTFGKDANIAVQNAAVCEQVAKMAFLTIQLNANTPKAPQFLLEKHFNRKHGKNAYYGQGEKK